MSTAVCQHCGGDVQLEVEFGAAGTAKLRAECADCHEAGTLQDDTFAAMNRIADSSRDETSEDQDQSQDEKLDHTDPEDLQLAYDDADGNIADAAERFEVTYGAVYNRLVNHDIHESNAQDADVSDASEETEGADANDSEEYWCGRCGYGPSSKIGVKRHHGLQHDGDPDIRETDPDLEDENVDDPTDSTSGGQGETAGDGGTEIETVVGPDAGTGIDDEIEASGDLDGLPFEIPDHVDAPTLEKAADECRSLVEVSEYVDWDHTGRVRSALFNLDLYQVLERPEAGSTLGGDR